jgi:hypothetical protein
MSAEEGQRASRDASVEVFLGDGEHRFRLALGELRKLEERRGTGPLALLARLVQGDWRVDDVIDTLRFGLIGGGKTDQEAAALLRAFVEPQPLARHALTAALVLGAALHGAPDDPIAEPADSQSEAPPAASGAASPSPQSTAPGP